MPITVETIAVMADGSQVTYPSMVKFCDAADAVGGTLLSAFKGKLKHVTVGDPDVVAVLYRGKRIPAKFRAPWVYEFEFWDGSRKTYHSAEAVADRFGVAKETVQRWINEGIAPQSRLKIAAIRDTTGKLMGNYPRVRMTLADGTTFEKATLKALADEVGICFTDLRIFRRMRQFGIVDVDDVGRTRRATGRPKIHEVNEVDSILEDLQNGN